MPQFDIIGKSQPGPCDPPDKLAPLQTPNAELELSGEEFTALMQQLDQEMYMIHLGVERICNDAINRAARVHGGCKTWAMKIAKRHFEDCDLAQSCLSRIVVRIVDKANDHADELCNDGQRCMKRCMSRCILREEGELPSGDNVSLISANPLDLIPGARGAIANATSVLGLPNISVETIVEWLIAGLPLRKQIPKASTEAMPQKFNRPTPQKPPRYKLPK